MQNQNNTIVWDDTVYNIFNLDCNNMSLEDFTTKLKKEKYIKNNYVYLSKNIMETLYPGKGYYYNTNKIRINVFLSYLLSHHSIKNDIPNCFYYSYNKGFSEVPNNVLKNILNTFQV